MQFTTKFEKGQQVWNVRKAFTTIKKPCEQCKGEKKITFTWPDNTTQTTTCSKCSGSGTSYLSDSRLVEKKITHIGTIYSIEISSPGRWRGFGRKEKDIEIAYALKITWKADSNDQTNIFWEDKLFTSEAEAQLHCTPVVNEPYDKNKEWSWEQD